MPIFMESSNASPIGFGLQLSNATNATSTNSAYFGTTTGNDLVLMTTNTRRVTVSSAESVSKLDRHRPLCTSLDQTHTRLALAEHQIVINTIITLDHYDKLEPVGYNWKGETKAKLGLIAQDAKKVCGEMVSIMLNENMKEERDNDLEGYQYTLDYSQLGALNAAVITLLIKK
ncbi:LOW QUALITY PROTEIN: Hypothetical protein PHPALM_2944 [Phytophthora palmivora]|uniref:Peptidase S74 domain-containing protein n=1 Tax=Phytophthora palmivora TaxID=4796 RepID=A0A2P4YNL0_9STRA|nr:LOW QUALITY PROTEIN: Hypothetical protein PHPALM_2944 [Phytophthora palmivora]